MAMDESRLSDESKEVLVIVRAEAAASRIPPASLAFLEDAVKMKDSLRGVSHGVIVLSKFIVRLSVFVTAVGGAYVVMKGWFGK